VETSYADGLNVSASQGSFVRQNTPFPKDLRTRHVKTPTKTVDGHMVAHNPHKLVCIVFVELLL